MPRGTREVLTYLKIVQVMHRQRKCEFTELCQCSVRCAQCAVLSALPVCMRRRLRRPEGRGVNLPRNRSGNAQTTKVCVQRAVSVLSALCSVRCQCACDGDWHAQRGEDVCQQREDLWRQRSGDAHTTEKKVTVVISCSEMRTVAPSVWHVPAHSRGRANKIDHLTTHRS